MTVIAKFSRLTPVPEGRPVYYNGYKVGKINKIDISDDSKFAYVYLGIYKKNLKLPINTVAKVEITKENDVSYIDLIYPTKPSDLFLTDHSVINGVLSKNINTFLETQIENGSLGNTSAELSDTLTKLDKLTQKLDKIADSIADILAVDKKATDAITDILSENKKDLRKMVNNSANTAANLDKITKGMDKFINDPDVQASLKETVVSTAKTTKNLKDLSGDKKLKQIILNMNETSENLKKVSLKVKNSTGDIKTTVNKANGVLDHANCFIKSLEHFINGLSDMLSKRFLFFRVMFGKPGSSLENPPQCGPVKK